LQLQLFGLFHPSPQIQALKILWTCVIAASACTQPMTMAARVRSSASCQTSGHQEAVRNMGMKNVISLRNETLKKLKGTRVGIELRPARSWAIKSKRVGLTKDLEPFANTLE